MVKNSHFRFTGGQSVCVCVCVWAFHISIHLFPPLWCFLLPPRQPRLGLAINTPSSRLEALPDGAGAICLADASLLTDCVCVCVCVCERERERLRKTVSKRCSLFFCAQLECACAGICECFSTHTVLCMRVCVCVNAFIRCAFTSAQRCVFTPPGFLLAVHPFCCNLVFFFSLPSPVRTVFMHGFCESVWVCVCVCVLLFSPFRLP